MKMKFLWVTAVIFSSHLYAQVDSTKNLDALVVTATKSIIKQSQTGKVVTVIDQATLQQNIGKTLSEILNYQSGIFVNGANNTLGTNQDIFLRGSSSGNTLILLDGIPVNDPSLISNSFDPNNLVLSQIERIEILKGAQSTLWGSSAVAGVINIISKKGSTKKISPSASISYGSYGTVKTNAGISGKNNRLNYNLSYNHTESKGFSSAYDSTSVQGFDKDGFLQNSFLANLGFAATKKFSITSSSNYVQYKSNLDAGGYKDEKDYTGVNSTLIQTVGMVYKTSKSDFHFTNTLVKTKRTLSDDSASVGGFAKFSSGEYNGNSFISELYANLKLAKKITLLSGLQRNAQNTDQSYLSISSYGPYESSLSSEIANVTNYSVYASMMLLNFSGFNLEAGVRYNQHSLYGNNTTYSFNPSYNVNANTRLFVNISSAFRIPSLYQLYSEYGNLKLKPEESNNYEVGAQVLSGNKNNSIRLVGFKRDIRQLIIFYTDPITYDGKYLNKDKQNDYGVELETELKMGKKVKWVNNITYVNGEGTMDNQKIKNFYLRPNFTMNSILNFQPTEKLTVSPSFRFVGNRLKGEYDEGPEKLSNYYTLDFYAGYNISKKIRGFVDARNITDQFYMDIIGYNIRRANFTIGITFVN